MSIRRCCLLCSFITTCRAGLGVVQDARRILAKSRNIFVQLPRLVVEAHEVLADRVDIARDAVDINAGGCVVAIRYVTFRIIFLKLIKTRCLTIQFSTKMSALLILRLEDLTELGSKCLGLPCLIRRRCHRRWFHNFGE